MITLLSHELRISLKAAGGPGTAISVFLLALVLFPLLIGPEADLLKRVGPGLIWLMAGLASLLYAPLLINEDIEDGTLEQLFLAPSSSVAIFTTKATTHFLHVGLPFTILSWLATPLYDLSLAQTQILCLTFLLGLPAISTLSLLGSTLCAGARGGNLLMMLLILPLMVPLFIFALSTVDALSLGLSPTPHLFLLAGSSLLILVLGSAAGQHLVKNLL